MRKAASEGRLDELDQVTLWPRAGDRLDRLAALEDGQGGYRQDAVVARGVRVGVDVQLDDLRLVAHFPGDLLEDRGHPQAGPAPFGPEVDQDRGVGLEYLGDEGVVRDGLGGSHVARSPASRYRCSVHQGGDVALGVERRRRAGAGGRDGLLVRVVDQVAGGEHTRLVGPGTGRVDQDVPVVVHVLLVAEQLAARVEADRHELRLWSDGVL